MPLAHGLLKVDGTLPSIGCGPVLSAMAHLDCARAPPRTRSWRSMTDMKRGAQVDAPACTNPLLDVVADAELSDESTVLVDVVLLDVGEETTTLTDEHEQAAAGVEVLLVGLHVLGELLDALGEDGHLDLGVAGVLRVLAVLGGKLRLALLGNRHDSTFRVTAAGMRSPMASIRPHLGTPPVERTSKVGVPTGRYVTTGQAQGAVIAQLAHVTRDFKEMVHCYEFSRVLRIFRTASPNGDDEAKANAVK